MRLSLAVVLVLLINRYWTWGLGDVMGEYADDAIERSLDEMFWLEDNPEDDPEPDSARWYFGAPSRFVPCPGYNKDPEKCRRCFGVVDHGDMVHAVDCKL